MPSLAVSFFLLTTVRLALFNATFHRIACHGAAAFSNGFLAFMAVTMSLTGAPMSLTQGGGVTFFLNSHSKSHSKAWADYSSPAGVSSLPVPPMRALPLVSSMPGKELWEMYDLSVVRAWTPAMIWWLYLAVTRPLSSAIVLGPLASLYQWAVVTALILPEIQNLPWILGPTLKYLAPGRNSTLVSIFTAGEGYRSTHMADPSSGRSGGYDPTFWLMRIMSLLGLINSLTGRSSSSPRRDSRALSLHRDLDAIYEGYVVHSRHVVTSHSFKNPLYLTATELTGPHPEAAWDHLILWSTRHPSLARLSLASYLTPDAVRALVYNRTGASHPAQSTRIVLLTHASYYGLHFNPISIYYLLNGDTGAALASVYEVTNTPWGEKTWYVNPVPEFGENINAKPASDPIPAPASSISAGYGPEWATSQPKVMHVSPFNNLDYDYVTRWSQLTLEGSSEPAPSARVSLRLVRQHGAPDNKTNTPKLSSTPFDFNVFMTLKRRSLTPWQGLKTLIAYPAMTLYVVLYIYYHAGLLFFARKVPQVTHPKDLAPEKHKRVTRHAPPDALVTKESAAAVSAKLVKEALSNGWKQ